MSGPYKPSHYTSTQDDQRTISRPVRRHLIHVYLALAAMCAVATAGSATGDALLGSAGTAVGSLGAVASVSMFRFTPMHSRSRWGLLFVNIKQGNKETKKRENSQPLRYMRYRVA
jgi:hypothetical protein